MDGAPRRAGAADTGRLATILASAFHDDPMMRWSSRGDSRYGRALGDTMTWLATEALKDGEAWALDHAAALIYTPQKPNVLPGRLGLLLIAPLVVGNTGFRRLPRLLALLDTLRRNHPAEPHWYLQFLGVEAGHQGKGHGGRLLQVLCAKADADGLPAWLENSNPKNTPLYMRYGFDPVREVRPRADAPPLLLMWRTARRAV